jgi:hypothetical protein
MPAHVDHQRRRRDRVPGLFLVVGVLVVALGLITLDVFRVGWNAVPFVDEAPAAGAEVASAVDTYAAFALARNAAREAGPSHEYTADGLLKLAAALDGVMALHRDPTTGVSVVPARLRAAAGIIRAESQSTDHADVVRHAFTGVADAMAELQRAHYPELERAVASVSDAARALRADRPLLQQRDALQHFFDVSADALRGMAGADR